MYFSCKYKKPMPYSLNAESLKLDPKSDLLNTHYTLYIYTKSQNSLPSE